MPANPIISIIMPCYNEGLNLSKSIESVFNQTFNDLELIVVDDGSTDNSLEILNTYQKRRPALRICSQSNSGAGPARNKGLKLAKGELIAFLDADDYWHQECLFRLYKKLKASPKAAIVYCGWQNVGLGENNSKPFVPKDYEGPNKIEDLLISCRWPIHAALTRRQAIDEVNGFDETWSSCMDYDLWLRISAFRKIVVLPEVLAFYNHHQGAQITKNRLTIAINHWKIQNKFIKNHPEIQTSLGKKRIREIIDGELLKRGYLNYWKRDLKASHTLFRLAMKRCFFSAKDLKYLLPALLPFRIYRVCVQFIDSLRKTIL